MKKITTLYKKNPNDLSLVINELNPENQWVLDGYGIPTRKFDGTSCFILNNEIYKRYDVKLKTGSDLKLLNHYIDLLNIGTTVTKVSNKKFDDLSFSDTIIQFIDKHPITGMRAALLENNGIIDLRQLKPNNITIPLKYFKNVPENAIPCQEPDSITGHWPHWVKCDRKNPEDKWHFIAFDALENKEDGTYELCGERINGNKEHILGYVLIKHGIETLSVTDFSFEGLKKYLSNPELDIEGIVFHHKIDGRMCKIRKCDFGIKR